MMCVWVLSSLHMMWRGLHGTDKCNTSWHHRRLAAVWSGTWGRMSRSSRYVTVCLTWVLFTRLHGNRRSNSVAFPNTNKGQTDSITVCGSWNILSVTCWADKVSLCLLASGRGYAAVHSIRSWSLARHTAVGFAFSHVTAETSRGSPEVAAADAVLLVLSLYINQHLLLSVLVCLAGHHVGLWG